MPWTPRSSAALILCENFVRNLAYYRAVRPDAGQTLLSKSNPQQPFWLQVHGNFLDQCVLDWCKLFADRKGEHQWPLLVQDGDSFQQALLGQLEVNSEQFDGYAQKMRFYRDSFVAHLDQENLMEPPHLDIAHKSVLFLHRHIFAKRGFNAAGCTTPENLVRGFDEWLIEAAAIYKIWAQRKA